MSTVLRALAAGLFISGLVVSLTVVNPVGFVAFVSYAGVGAYLVLRRPSNMIGWVIMAAGWGLACGSTTIDASPTALLAGELAPIVALTAWMNAFGWALALTALFTMTIVFPDGRWPTGRARSPAALALLLLVAMTLVIAFDPTISLTLIGAEPLTIPNPAALLPASPPWTTFLASDALYPVMFPILVGGVVNLSVRFRRSTGLLRLQYRWLVASVMVMTAGTIAWVVLYLVLGQYDLAWVVVAVTYPTVPLAVMVAVLRYRLFEIDRLISRTVAYAVVTATLAMVFVGVVLGLQAMLEQFVGGNTIAVAASTLVVAALFQPLHRRVQRTVDRRFNRARYDAQRTADAFASKLRDEVDMAAVVDALDATVNQALGPTSTGLWLHRGESVR